MKLDDLKKPFPADQIEWRIGSTNKDKTAAIALAYIDARDVMGRFDEVCGAGNWQCTHPHANGKTSCRIGIKVGDEWVWKENGCGDSQVEAEKGAFSDSFKRAAVLWGVGRYLYDVPNIWVDTVPYGRSQKIKNPNDPKLLKALKDAEKGIRGVNEPEPQKPTENVANLMADAEFDALAAEAEGAKNIEELEITSGKARAAYNAKRMTKPQANLFAEIKERMTAKLVESPLQAAE